MKCSEAELYIMKYMDGELSDGDAQKLNTHMAACEDCKESFYTYDLIMTEFSEEIFAPSGLESKIMANISCITPNFIITDNRKADNFNGIVWGIFSVMFGLGVILSLYSTQIMGYLSTNDSLQYMYAHLLPSVELVKGVSSTVVSWATGVTSQVGQYFQSVRFVILAALAVLVGLQFVLYRRNKVKAEA